jgi:hypothetical protein
MTTLTLSPTPATRPTALLIQPQGHNRESVYAVFYLDGDGREQRREVDVLTFWRLHDTAGEASYSEPGYWAYEVEQ